MPRIPPLHPHDAPPDSRTVYDEFYREMSFPAPPNFIMTQGHAPRVARGTWELVRNVLVNGRIDRWIKELLFVAISQDRQCQYCTAAHIACCRMLGVDPNTLVQLSRAVRSIPDERVRDIILFGLKAAREPQGLTDKDFTMLRQHRLTQAEIVEVIAMAALAVYANIMADATGMEADEMFETIGQGK